MSGFFLLMTIVFIDIDRERFYPFTLTRPCATMRVGITTLEEKWLSYYDGEVYYQTEDYLQGKYKSNFEEADLIINPLVIPSDKLVYEINSLKVGEALYVGSLFVASKGNELTKVESNVDVISIDEKWDLFQKNGACIKIDFDRITKGRTSEKLPNHVTVIGDNPVFVENGAIVNGSFINTNDGPVYIGKGAEVMEGSIVRGPLAICDHATIKMGAKIYGDTTIGPYSKVGGEVSNSVIFGYSNKGHDGFIGNSVLGEWCNLGADTNSSNLKNNYSPVRIWSYKSNKMEDTNLQFCGVLMGDHSKTGINTMLNTATVVGVCANIFGGDFPEKFIPSFSWGGANGFVPFKIEKAQEVAERMMERRKVEFTQEDLKIFQAIQEKSKKYKMS